MEDRTLLSTITWTNRGTPSDEFDSTFGANANVARGVIDGVIASWERAIDNFNQPSGGNNINMTISMSSTGTGFGGGASVTAFDSGFPTAGTFTISRGSDITGDGLGDGAGWFLDPTPLDNSEFTGAIQHAFTGDATPGGPADGMADLFTVVNAELSHVVGLFLAPGVIQNPMMGMVTDTGIVDNSEGGGVGTYFVFDGPSVTHLFTSNNGGAGGNDFMELIHTAGRPGPGTNQPVTFNSAFRGSRDLVGNDDLGNAIFEFSRRYMVNDVMALVFQDAYGYDITLPQTFGTMYSVLNETTGELMIRGGTSLSNDVIGISISGSDLVVSVDIGNDVPGSGPNGDDSNIAAFVSRFPLSTVNSITIQTGDGLDTINLVPLAIPVNVDGGSPSFFPGDTLNFDAQGALTTDTGTVIQTPGFADVNYINIETVQIINAGPNLAPTVSSAVFVLPISSSNGTIVGTVVATDPNFGDVLTYAITAGNDAGTFAINTANGLITVADNSAFQTEDRFFLTVEVTDLGGLTGSGSVLVVLQDTTTTANVSAIFVESAGALIVTTEGPGPIEITVSGSAVLVNNLPPETGPLLANQIISIQVTGGGGGNFINLGDVTVANGFTNVMNNIHVTGTDGADTIIVSPLGGTYLGGDGDDFILGGPGDDTIHGQNGEDVINGGGGADSINGGDGGDVINAGGGDDFVLGGDGDDQINGGGGADNIRAGNGADTVDGGRGDDTLNGGVGNDLLTAGKGNDTLIGGSGDDMLFGENGADLLKGGGGNDTLDGGIGDDRLEGGADDDLLLAQEGADTLKGGGGADTLLGGDGDDNLMGGGGPDSVDGGDGADTIRGGGGGDTLIGGRGDDWVKGQGGADTLFGGGGADTLDGGRANDFLAAAAPDSGALFALDSFFGVSNLHRIDPTDGSSTFVGTTNVRSLIGLASNSTGALFSIDEASTSDSLLYRVEMQTGLSHPQLVVRSNATFGEGGLTYDAATNQIFAIDDAGQLLQIDVATQAVLTTNQVMANGMPVTGFAGLTFRGGDLYGLIIDAPRFDNTLVKIDTTTFEPVDLIPVSGDLMNVSGLTWNPFQDLFYVAGQGQSNLLSIDPATGLTTLLGSTGLGTVSGLTFAPGLVFEDVTLLGGPGNDTLIGSEGNDVLRGQGGNDSLDGGGGDDDLMGAAGKDTLVGNGGDDNLQGGGGDDVILGDIDPDDPAFDRFIHTGNDTIVWRSGDGDDTVNGGFGTDEMQVSTGASGDTVTIGTDDAMVTIHTKTPTNPVGETTHSDHIELFSINTNSGRDTVIVNDLSANFPAQLIDIITGGGRDTVDASAQADTRLRIRADGGMGNDSLTGGAGPDTLLGNMGDDVLNGSGGDDSLAGGEGFDTLSGGKGNDRLNGETDDDELHGNAGDDTLDGAGGNDILFGGSGGDLLLGNIGDDVLMGQGGRDVLDGGSGDDVLDGAVGNDTLMGGLGADTLSGGSENDVLSGGDNSDVLSGGIGNDVLMGDLGNDLLNGDDGDDTLSGGFGNDTLNGGAGADDLDGDDGNDMVNGDAGRDSIRGGNGADTLSGGNGNDTLNGGDGNDVINGDAGNDGLAGHDGHDILRGGGGEDTLIGGDGDDTLRGGDDADALVGSQGDDNLDGQAAIDTLSGGPGFDVLTGVVNDVIDESIEALFDPNSTEFAWIDQT